MDTQQKQDIFDRIMHLPGLRLFEPIYIKYKRVLLYVFFGGITFFLNIFLFRGIDAYTGLNELVNNVICWVICVAFQFFTNRTWVFDGRVDSAVSFVKQLISFFTGRLMTLLMEEAILFVFITLMHGPTMTVKLIAQVVVIVANYVISKLWVFKDK